MHDVDSSSGQSTVTSGPGTAMSRRTWRILLGLIVVLGVALRVGQLNASDLWADELYSLEHATGYGYVDQQIPKKLLMRHLPLSTHLDGARAWWHIWPAARTDNHPPVYQLLLRLWMDCFGDEPAAIRSLSVVASVVALVLTAHVGRLLHGPVPALWGALLFACAVPQIHHARDARSYAMMLAWAMGAAAALIHIEQRGPSWRRLVALGACLFLAVMTHYFAVAAAGALLVYALIRLRGNARRLTALAFVISGLLFVAIWSASMLAQRAVALGANNAWLLQGLDKPGFAGHVRGTARRIATMPMSLLTEGSDIHLSEPGLPDSSLAAAGAGIVYVLPFLLLAWHRRRDLLLWGVLLIGIVALPAALDLARGTYFLMYTRYTLLAGPAVYMIFAAALSDLRGPVLRSVVPAIALVTALVNSSAAYQSPMHTVRPVATTLSRHVGPEDAIVIFDDGKYPPWVGYLFLTIDYYVHPLPAPIVRLTEPPRGRLLDELRGRRRLWVVSGGPQPTLQEMLPGAVVLKRFNSDLVALCAEVQVPPNAPRPSGPAGSVPRQPR